ncbi:MAG: porin [Hyphomicrobiaceae bacterium]
MFGKLLELVPRATIIAILAMAANTGAIQAADLGGDCCADLEERVAELEATTVRKGNRRVSLTLSGFVNEAVLFWDDGFENNAYIVTNNNARTRFRFRGNAKINSDWSAGFYIEIGMRRTNNSEGVNQFEQDPVGMDVRHQALFVKSETFGTVWLGHTNDSIRDLIEICVACPLSNQPRGFEIWGGFFVNLGDGIYLSKNLKELGAGVPFGDGARQNVIRWVSPTWAGFQLSADVGEDDTWSAALRYKSHEFHGFQIAGGIGYGEFTEEIAKPLERVAGAISIGHKPSGLYWAFSAGQVTDNNVGDRDILQGEAAGFAGDFWWTTVGLGRKWHALGKTTIYGQYGKYAAGDVGQADVFNAQTRDVVVSTVTILDTEYKVWSFGLNQKVDAAALELYVAYYNVQGDIDTAERSMLSSDTFHALMTGARIQF